MRNECKMTKRVLITGGAGFVAHHLIGQVLKTTDWEIISLDRLDYSGNLNRLHDIMLTFDAETRKRVKICLLYTSPSPRDKRQASMPSSA